MNVPDARRATREGGVRHGSALGVVLVALMVMLGAFAVPALADVTRSDIRAAEAAAAEAAATLRAAESDLAAAERHLDRIEESLVSVGERLDSQEVEVTASRTEARERIARMYMSAGGADRIGLLGVQRIADIPAHTAYLGALAEQDREFVNRLASSRDDLVRLKVVIEESMGAQEGVIAGLATVVEARRSDLQGALGAVDSAEAQWQRQEEERRAREEAERLRQQQEEQQRREDEQRRQEEEEQRRQEALAKLQAAAAAAAAAGWTPGAGVEPWRLLVEKHFPGRLVEEALAVMRCESAGNPLSVNKYSAASGLFQHLPYYWPARAVKAGWPGADIFDPEANIAVSAWLVRVTEDGGRDAWSHWSCKP